MDHVKAPERGSGVEQDVLEVCDEVQGRDRAGERNPERDVEVVEQTEAAPVGEPCDSHRGGREQESQNERVDEYEREIDDPASGRGHRFRAKGCREFPERHHEKNTHEERDPDRGFGLHHVRSRSGSISSPSMRTASRSFPP